jgi:glycosyltransferase involved in cell wall biosynthesis
MSIHPLKVTHAALSLDVGGLERNIVNQIRQAPVLGQEISVIALERAGTLAPAAESLGATVLCASKRPGLRPQIALRLRAMLKRLDPDIVHTHQIGPLFYIRLATMGLRKPPIIVHTEHGKEPYADSRKLRALARFGAQRAQVFYCLTNDMADAVLAHRIAPADRVRVIRNGIDFSNYAAPRDTRAIRESLNIPQGAAVIGTIGRLTEIKRQEVLLKAFTTLSKTIPAAHLLLVGDGPLRRELEQLAGSLNIAARVHFAGYQADTAPYLHAMNVFVLPSRSEGTPQSILEACIAHIPVIASRVGGIPEVIRHDETGLLFESGDEQSLAKLLIELLGEPDRARSLAVSAKRFVESRFDIRRMAREYHEEFVRLLAAREATPQQGLDLIESPASAEHPLGIH